MLLLALAIGRTFGHADDSLCTAFALFMSMATWSGLIVGLVAGCIWLAPWLQLTQTAPMYNVDAAAANYIAANQVPDAGLFYFSSSSAIVLQSVCGYAKTSKKVPARSARIVH